MRIVLDTDVMVAAMRSDQGASRQLLLAALDRRVVVLASVPLIACILEMDYWKFQIANVLSAMVWAYVLLAFGDFGMGIFKWFV